jgi:hypothetical protein
MRNALLATVGLAVLAIGMFAFLFRYEPVSSTLSGMVWDRFTQRMCFAGDSRVEPPGGPFCTAQDYIAAVDAAAATRKAAALDRVTAAVRAGVAADTPAAEDRLAAAIVATKAAGASQADIDAAIK